MARLVRTQVEMEGRYEDRWTLVEDDTPPSTTPRSALAVVGHPHTRVSAAARVTGAARFISDITPAGDAACRGAAQPPRQRPRRRRSTSRPPPRSPACAR